MFTCVINNENKFWTEYANSIFIGDWDEPIVPVSQKEPVPANRFFDPRIFYYLFSSAKNKREENKVCPNIHAKPTSIVLPYIRNRFFSLSPQFWWTTAGKSRACSAVQCREHLKSKKYTAVEKRIPSACLSWSLLLLPSSHGSTTTTISIFSFDQNLFLRSHQNVLW